MIAVLVSGGIDSLVAAYLLKKEHSPVIGLYLRTGYNDLSAKEVQMISDRADIPVETIDCRDGFKTSVVDYFVDAYLRGETPNPCLRCNPHIKFGIGLDYALDRGADFVASGHYCRIRQDQQVVRLVRGLDSRKDQSYFLGFLTRTQIARIRFPVGDMIKSDVLTLAGEKGLVPVVARESQDICFIGKEETYADFIGRQGHWRPRPGLIEDVNGKVIGEHDGVHLFTVGQRRGINCPAEKPYYVAAIDVARNRIRVGPREELLSSRGLVRAVNWIDQAPEKELLCSVKVRYQHVAAPARVAPLPDGSAAVTFDQPQFGIAPGQGAVFYQGDMVLGGGIISGLIQ